MDRYYSILGIPNNSSKEVIKKAYHTKIKALHPDKIHGTALEDTATFFVKEINEAYNQLIKNLENNTTSSTSTSSSKSNFKERNFIEEDIYVETLGYLKYTLANDLYNILHEIINRIKCDIPVDLHPIPWQINTGLSPNVKNSMNKHNMDFSMTSCWDGSIEYVIINKRSGNNWYFAAFEVKTKKKPANTRSNYNSNSAYSCSKKKYSFGSFIKVVVAIIVIGFFYQQCSSMRLANNNFQTASLRPLQTNTNVVSADWLNVRRTPSSVNNNNIIEEIRFNTRVEIIERANNGWVRIRYNNGKTGYVHGNFLR